MSKQVIGTLTVRDDYEMERRGETACNYTIYRVKKGDYPVYVKWNAGRRVLWADMDAEIIEDYYVNRVFTSSSVDHKHYEPGEKPTTMAWTWGYHSSFFSCPPMAICGGKHRLVLNEGWVINATVSGGHYSGGAPIIQYEVAEEAEAQK